MIYLKRFNLLSDYNEHNLMRAEERKIFNNVYPLHIFPLIELESIAFKEITIFYGGNGSGKSTLLNIIASKLNAIRKSPINKGAYFDLYVKMTDCEFSLDYPTEIKAITSDDVFDYLLDIRSINTNVNRRKERLSMEYLNNKFKSEDNMENYENIKNISDSKSKTMSEYIRARLSNNNIIEQSNGESALLFWEKEIKENAIYILDEPENSLSAENQLKLKKFIEDSARFYNCQFIISTHSPFLLALEKWTNLKNVKLYYDFFKEKEKEFEE